jgi:acetylornithine deacetylase/succinyl-diaminopimelate desuccinylase-like protein
MTAVATRRLLLPLLLTWALTQPAALAQAADSAPLDPTARLLQELIAIDTSNPPGREAALADFLAARLAPLGFEIDIVPTPEAGKAHLIARLRGNGSRKPVLIAAHADVVGVERDKWSIDPFAGTVQDGYLYGRGAIDFKGGIAVFTRAVMMLAENRVPLDRDVILLVEADEEGGTYDTSWLAEDHWDKIDCEFALNEGGWILMDDQGQVDYVSISTADKVSVSFLITARGTSTHSSMPLEDNAIFRLTRAMSKLADYQTRPQLIPSTRQFFATLARTDDGPMSEHYRNIAESDDPAKIAAADAAIREHSALFHALIRNTIAPVFLDAGFRGNVIPGHATATVNFRMIPGTDPEALRREIAAVVGGEGIEVSYAAFVQQTPEEMAAERERTMSMQPSSEATELYRSLATHAKRTYPEAEVTPYLFNAGTDAKAWRVRGIPVYGIYPYPITRDDLMRMHGNDERVPVRSLTTGTRMIYDVLVDVAGTR